MFDPTTSPGYTDYPVADIEAHRSLAKWNQRFGLLATIGGIVAVELWAFPVLLPVTGVALFACGQGMDIQALCWEVELLQKGENR